MRVSTLPASLVLRECFAGGLIEQTLILCVYSTQLGNLAKFCDGVKR